MLRKWRRSRRIILFIDECNDRRRCPAEARSTPEHAEPALAPASCMHRLHHAERYRKYIERRGAGARFQKCWSMTGVEATIAIRAVCRNVMSCITASRSPIRRSSRGRAFTSLLTDRISPDKAIDLIDEGGAHQDGNRFEAGGDGHS